MPDDAQPYPIASDDRQPPGKPDATEKQGCLSWSLRLIAAVPIVLAGAFYGVVAHRFFSSLLTEGAKGRSGLMLWSFLFGVPVGLGLLVGFLARRRRKAGLAGASVLSMLSTLLFVFAGGALLREGSICIVMALPLLLILGVIGAILGAIFDALAKDNGPKLLSVTLMLPLVLGYAESEMSTDPAHQRVVRSILIAAPPETIWQHLNFPLGIEPAELAGGVAYRMGVPFPIEARTLEGRVGGERALVWQRGIRFREVITDWQPDRFIAWRYDFAPNSFPPGSLDDHVVIGGRYFNLDATSYALTPEAGGTRLTIAVDSHVATHFNWYAGWWAGWLVSDTADAILKFYKHRAERGTTPVSG